MAQFTKNSVVHCPHTSCGKPLLSQLALWEGTTFVMRCPSCLGYVRIQASYSVIMKRAIIEPKERALIDHEQ